MRVKTVADVEDVLNRIADAAGDYEVAHSLEDDLHRAVLAAIANGEHDDSAMDMARMALKTGDIEFARYCA